MTGDEAILSELKEIKFHLSLLTQKIRSEAFGAFENEILRTDPRIRMWRVFDGKLGPVEVGKLTEVTGQGVRDMIQDPAIAPFLHVAMVGRSPLPSRNIEAVLDWYLAK
jgi:hypothetical protein